MHALSSSFIQQRNTWRKSAKPESISISDLSLEMQMRDAGTEADHVGTVIHQIQNKEPMEPLDVVRLDGRLVLVDGYHRLAAYKELGEERIDAYVYTDLTKEDAELFAYCTNINKGLKSKPADVHKAILALIASDAGEEKFRRGYDLDIPALHEYTGVARRTIEEMTKALRESWKCERNNRIQSLSDEGCTHAQIAEKVGVSSKTVSRTLKEADSGQTRKPAEMSGLSPLPSEPTEDIKDVALVGNEGQLARAKAKRIMMDPNIYNALVDEILAAPTSKEASSEELQNAARTALDMIAVTLGHLMDKAESLNEYWGSLLPHDPDFQDQVALAVKTLTVAGEYIENKTGRKSRY